MTQPRQIAAPTSARGRGASTQAATTHLAPDTAAPAPALVIEPDVTDTERLAQLLSNFGSVEGFTARIERTRTGTMPAELCGYLGSMMFGDEFLDDIRQEHGGGKFRARIYDARGDYKTSFPFAIAGAPKRPSESTAAPVGVGPASAAGETQLERMVRELAASVAAMAAAIGQAHTAPRSAEDELERSLKLLRALKEVAPAPAADTSLSHLETFFRLQDMIDERGPRGAGGTGDNIGRIVEHGVKPIAALMTRSLDIQERQMNNARQSAGLRRVAAPAPIAGHVDIADTVDPADAIGDTLTAAEQLDYAGAAADPVVQLAASIPPLARSYLANQAKNDRDPETYAVMALDTIQEESPEAYAQLGELLRRPDFAAALLDAVPQWGIYHEWFTELVDAMRAQLAESDVSDVGDAGEAGEPVAAAVAHQENAA